MWRHQQSIMTSSAEGIPSEWDTGTMSFMQSFCRVRNKMIYVLSWRTVSALTRVLFLCLFPSLLRNSGNKYKNNLSLALKQFVTRVHTLFSIWYTCDTNTLTACLPVYHYHKTESGDHSPSLHQFCNRFYGRCKRGDPTRANITSDYVTLKDTLQNEGTRTIIVSDVSAMSI